MDHDDRGDYQSTMKSLYRTGGREAEPSVYQSQQLYNLKGLQRSSKRQSNRSLSAKRNSVNGSLSLKSMNHVKMDGFRKQLMESGQEGAQTQRQPSAESKKRTLSRYLAGRPRLCEPDAFPVSPEIRSPRDNRVGHQALKNISSLQAVSLQEQLAHQRNEPVSARESGQRIPAKVSPADAKFGSTQVRGAQKSPPSFIQHSHLQQSRTLTMKSLES